MGRLDPAAIYRVRSAVWPVPENADELHDALVSLGFFTEQEVAADALWQRWLQNLTDQRRATRVLLGNSFIWVAAERLQQFHALKPDLRAEPPIALRASDRSPRMRC